MSRWETSKKKKKCFSSATKVTYSWNQETLEVKAEVGKGNWQLIGIAKDISELNSLYDTHESSLLAKLASEELELSRQKAVASLYQKNIANFRELFPPGSQIYNVYKAFCDSRAGGFTCEDIIRAMSDSIGGEESTLWVHAMEIFRKEGRK